MPGKNIVKSYVKDGIYHIYNRGVEKRKIFLDDKDHKVFLSYLKTALSPRLDVSKITKNFTLQGSTLKGMPRQPKNFHGSIELLAYCLVPNHFHFLIKQLTEKAIKDFMQSLFTRYSMYFNLKYKRVGTLFQNIYKAALVMEEPYLLHLSRYIHRNCLTYVKNLLDGYSSYAEYLRLRHNPWVKPDLILSYFDTVRHPFLKRTNSYQSFV